MTKITCSILPAFDDNYIYLFFDPEEAWTAIVDPGEARPALEGLEKVERKLTHILVTHHHADHIGGNKEIKEKTGCQIIGPETIPGVDKIVKEGEFFLGSHPVKVLETPGHTLDHISFFLSQDECLFCGDTLFSMGCGRLFEGTAEQMWDSLKKIRALPSETLCYCGHEYTLANARFAITVDPNNQQLQQRLLAVEEKRHQGEITVPFLLRDECVTNPFLRVDAIDLQVSWRQELIDPEERFFELRQQKDLAS